MSKDKIEVNMNVYDIPILVEALEEANKEIERLKELCNKYEEEHKTTFETWQKDIKENEHFRTALNTKENIIKEVREYIESIVTIKCKYFDYNKALENMIISYDELKKKVEEVGTLEGHFIEVNRDKILEILDKGE